MVCAFIRKGKLGKIDQYDQESNENLFNRMDERGIKPGVWMN